MSPSIPVTGQRSKEGGPSVSSSAGPTWRQSSGPSWRRARQVPAAQARSRGARRQTLRRDRSRSGGAGEGPGFCRAPLPPPPSPGYVSHQRWLTPCSVNWCLWGMGFQPGPRGANPLTPSLLRLAVAIRRMRRLGVDDPRNHRDGACVLGVALRMLCILPRLILTASPMRSVQSAPF